MCVQTAVSGDSGADIVGQEDCLTLNIWTPERTTETGPAPVMVWFHGGYANWGSSSKRSNGVYRYDGQYLAEHTGVIIVTLNYRLGPLGFLSLPQLSAETEYHGSGNYGHMDQIAALQWVQRNIAAFGGDRNRVTIFGHSAGGTSVGTLFLSPRAKGLFSAAIEQSGGFPFRPRMRMESYGTKLAKALHCDKSASVTACLRSVPAADLLTALPEGLANGGAYYKTSVDGYVVTKPWPESVSAGEYNDVPLMIGTTADESATMLSHFIGTRLPDSPRDYPELVTQYFGAFGISDIVPQVLKQFPATRFGSPAQTLVRLTSEWDMTCQNRRFIRALAKSPRPPSVFQYYYSHVFHDGPLKTKGAAHGMELPFIFHVFPNHEAYVPSTEELELSDLMATYWTQFAAHRNPSAEGLPAWPAYDRERESYLVVDLNPVVQHRLLSDDCDFWDGV
jgi:para-nitrobenzyl esterase